MRYSIIKNLKIDKINLKTKKLDLIPRFDS